MTFRSVAIALADAGEGQLRFRDDRLVAVFVRLTGVHGDEAGRWFLEAGFGALDGPAHPTFASLEEAAAWIEATLASSARHQAT